MRAWMLTADCPCGQEIPEVEQFAQEPFCCTACRRELVLIHDCCEGDCYDYTMPVADVEPWQVFGRAN